ncbi:MAG: delta-60 repeat domain-containing protein [Planctomycetota bacterium]|nr:delta-60 repeat domain-containing protein [Planctomycetota bacterium]
MAEGRILAAGRTAGVGFLDMAIWRLAANGSLDTTFNGQGWVTHDDAAGGMGFDIGNSIVTDGSGRILVGGQSVGAVTFDDLAIWQCE